MNTVLHIKNMVCGRCIKVVVDELAKLDIKPESVKLGEVIINGKLNSEKNNAVRKSLNENGFELIDDKKGQIIDKIKTEIINIVHHKKDLPSNVNLSDYLSREVGYDYSYISNLFSVVAGTTIEKYLILQKVEKIKELIVYDELNLNEIAFELGYSSVQHLSRQFKKVTGLTPTFFKKMKDKNRNPLDKI